MRSFTYQQVLNLALMRHPKLRALVLEDVPIIDDINQDVLDLIRATDEQDHTFFQRRINWSDFAGELGLSGLTLVQDSFPGNGAFDGHVADTGQAWAKVMADGAHPAAFSYLGGAGGVGSFNLNGLAANGDINKETFYQIDAGAYDNIFLEVALTRLDGDGTGSGFAASIILQMPLQVGFNLGGAQFNVVSLDRNTVEVDMGDAPSEVDGIPWGIGQTKVMRLEVTGALLKGYLDGVLYTQRTLAPPLNVPANHYAGLWATTSGPAGPTGAAGRFLAPFTIGALNPALSTLPAIQLPDWVNAVYAVNAIFATTGFKRRIRTKYLERIVRDQDIDDVDTLDTDDHGNPLLLAYLENQGGSFQLVKSAQKEWPTVADVEFVVTGLDTLLTQGAQLTSHVPLPYKALRPLAEKLAVHLGQRADLPQQWIDEQDGRADAAYDRFALWAGDMMVADDVNPDPDIVTG